VPFFKEGCVYLSRLRKFKKELRISQTDAEGVLWHHLRDRNILGFKFRRQHILQGYIVDFVCLEKKLIIELDGSHHAEQEKYDDVRTEKLKNDGFYVMRFWNSDVLNNLSIVLDIIYNALENKKAPLTRRAKNARRPLPQGER